MPVEGGLGAGIVAQGVKEVGAVLVHAVVDLDCFVLSSLLGTVGWGWVTGGMGEWGGRYPHGSIKLFILRGGS